MGEHTPGFVRLTASDRPGVAQPVPERDIPARPWGRVQLISLLVLLPLLAGWELYWRDYGATPSSRNSNGQWATQRRRVDEEPGDKLVIIGSSRELFDVQLPAWQEVTGERPIQLALQGTSPMAALEGLAKDEQFSGRLLIGIAPDLFFSGAAGRADVFRYYPKESPSQRFGNWLSTWYIEPFVAFDDGDFSLSTVVRRQAWPLRPGYEGHIPVRKLSVSEPDRNTHLWAKVENDPDYRALCRGVWADRFVGKPPPGMETPERAKKTIAEQIDKAVAAVKTLGARGVKVVFVRLPSVDDYYAFEQKAFPRAETWDLLIARSGVPGLHFEDHPEMQGYTLPEWSHMAAADADRFTRAFAPLVERTLAGMAVDRSAPAAPLGANAAKVP